MNIAHGTGVGNSASTVFASIVSEGSIDLVRSTQKDLEIRLALPYARRLVGPDLAAPTNGGQQGMGTYAHDGGRLALRVRPLFRVSRRRKVDLRATVSPHQSTYRFASTSSTIRETMPATGRAPRSSPERSLTAAAPAADSLSPTMSM